MKGPIRLSVLFVLFLGINQSWGQRLEASKQWVNGMQQCGYNQNWYNTQAVRHLVFDNDSLFAFHFGPNVLIPSYLAYDTVIKSLGDKGFFRDSYGYQVYSPSLDFLSEKRSGRDYLWRALAASNVPREIEPQEAWSPTKLHIRRSKLGLVSLNSGTISGSYWSPIEDTSYFFQYYKQGIPAKAYALDNIYFNKGNKQLFDFSVTTGNNYLVSGTMNVGADSSNIFIASYSPFGHLNWIKIIEQPGSQSIWYQELDRNGYLNLTVSGTKNAKDSPYQIYKIDTAGRLVKIVEFKLSPLHFDSKGFHSCAKVKPMTKEGNMACIIF